MSLLTSKLERTTENFSLIREHEPMKYYIISQELSLQRLTFFLFLLPLMLTLLSRKTKLFMDT